LKEWIRGGSPGKISENLHLKGNHIQERRNDPVNRGNCRESVAVSKW
jgi:hypothetical protein